MYMLLALSILISHCYYKRGINEIISGETDYPPTPYLPPTYPLLIESGGGGGRKFT